MKRLMFIGPSQCGKTSLTQSLRGEALHYKKTRAIEWSPMAIDTPGEYGEPLPVQRPADQRLRGRRYRHGVKCRRSVVAVFSGFYRPDEPPDDWPCHQSRSRRPAAYFAGRTMAYAGWRPADFYYQRVE